MCSSFIICWGFRLLTILWIFLNAVLMSSYIWPQCFSELGDLRSYIGLYALGVRMLSGTFIGSDLEVPDYHIKPGIWPLTLSILFVYYHMLQILPKMWSTCPLSRHVQTWSLCVHTCSRHDKAYTKHNQMCPHMLNIYFGHSYTCIRHVKKSPDTHQHNP